MKNISLIAVVSIVLFAGAMSLQAAEDGKALFGSKCAMCHGQDGKKAAGVKYTEEGTKKGKAPKMPAYEGKLTPEQVKAVVDYANTL